MTAVEFEPDLRATLPACRLVPDRVLRRILHELIDLGRPVVVNTRLPWWVARVDLAAVDELDPAVTSGDDDPLLFLVEPRDRSDAAGTDRDVLAEYRRLLVHAEVYRRVSEGIVSGRLTRSGVETYFRHSHWDYEADARAVLTADHLVPYDADWSVMLPRFVAVAWVRLETEPEDFCRVFPAAPSAAAARLALEQVVDTMGLPAVKPVRTIHSMAGEPASVADPVGASARAERAARRGNHARAAILWNAAGETAKAESAIRTGFMGLVAPALKLDAAASARWGDAILPFLGAAGRGPWPHAARALYDLQRLGLTLSGDLFAVDPGRWVKSLGREPLRQPLTRALPVLRCRAVAGALRHVEKAKLVAEVASPLTELLTAARDEAEAEARADYTPRVTDALDAVGLVPTTVVERVARDKLVNELVDRACDRGYLRFGHLRDAIARSDLKLPDLRGREWLAGDPLLKADRRLAESLTGVYHRGEVYLRGIQRASAAAFGTCSGRLLSKYVALPFGGAFLALEFTQHMVHAGQGLYRFASKMLAPKPLPDPVSPAEEPPKEPEWIWDWELNDWVPNFDAGEAVRVVQATVTSTPADQGLHIVTWPAILGVGLFLLAIFYWPAFRSAVGRALSLAGTGLRFLFRDLPLGVWQSGAVRTLRRHPYTRLFNRRFGTGVLVAVIAAGVLWFFGASPGRIARSAALWFALVSLVRMLPAGRKLEDRLAEAVADGWRLLRVNLIPGLFGWFVRVFRELAAWVERTLYAVDEWFRFREGQSKPSYHLKVALAFVWYPVAYVIRFAFNLLLEPQVNPVKHFPVVTVSHKVLFTALIPLSNATGIPEATLAVIFTGIPGIFGFLAWELKENWRLYAANRPPTLRPVRLGHHGETMRGLLRPGFHSGTVPKQFRAIRRQLGRPPAERKEYAIAKSEHELHHVEHAVRLFIEREFLALLAVSREWGHRVPQVGAVHLTNTSVRIDLVASSGSGEAAAQPAVCLVYFLDTGEVYAEMTSTEDHSDDLQFAFRGLAAKGAAAARLVRLRTAEDVTWQEWTAYWDGQASGRDATTQRQSNAN